MSDHAQRTAEERAVQVLLRTEPVPVPSAEFRERLRAEWMAAPPRPARVVPFRRAVIGLAAAAMLATFFVVANRGPAWELAGVTGEGRILVGETVVPAEDAAATLPGLLRPGTSILAGGETQIDLAIPGILVLQMAPGSRLTVPGTPGRWVGRAVTGEVALGEVRFVTGPRFDGVRLTLDAPAARIHAVGTTFAVIASPESTCVCVLEGEVRMEGTGGPAEVVAAGTRRTLFTGRAEVVDEEIFPMERRKLEMLRDRVAADAP